MAESKEDWALSKSNTATCSTIMLWELKKKKKFSKF